MKTLALILLLGPLAGCMPYPQRIVDTSQLTVGMTSDQVIQVLGTNVYESVTRSSNGAATYAMRIAYNWKVYCTFNQNNALVSWYEFRY